MSLLRNVLAIVLGLFAVIGFGASLLVREGGNPAEYVTKLDQSPVPMLSLGLLAAAFVLAFIPPGGEESEA